MSGAAIEIFHLLQTGTLVDATGATFFHVVNLLWDYSARLTVILVFDASALDDI